MELNVLLCRSWNQRFRLYGDNVEVYHDNVEAYHDNVEAYCYYNVEAYRDNVEANTDNVVVGRPTQLIFISDIHLLGWRW